MKSEVLTDKQKELYVAIKEFINENGYAPTMRQMCEITGNSSTSVVANKLYQLKKKGYVNFVPYKSRTLRITKKLKE